MKRYTLLFIFLITAIGRNYASPVTIITAQKVAVNFFFGVSHLNITNATLAHTETEPAGLPLYYVFNINDSDGFVIISADDALYPVIGYSTEKKPYTIPEQGTNIDYWMQKRKTEIINDIAIGVKATHDISNQWTSYINNIPVNTGSTDRAMGGQFPSSTLYLVKSTWGQSAPYKNDCPGTGSNQALTGCIATCMCQIMRYWQYPLSGQGSYTYYSSYYGDSLSANFNHTYNWAAMPLTNPNSSDTDLERVMYDAGISVQMKYGPTLSGSYMITKDDSVACAQIALVKYFGYFASTISGIDEDSNVIAWQDTLENELNLNRPIEYAGVDTVKGGHSWICDGYDAANNFHMNWGWNGSDNGWYSLSNLNPGGAYFSKDFQALLGIMPNNPLGVNEVANNSSVNIYPNPTNGNIMLSLNLTEEGNYNLAVTDILGQTVYANTIHLSGPYTTSINMADYGKGLYFIALSSDSYRTIKKVVVE